MPLLLRNTHFPPTKGNMPEKQKGAQTINEKPENHLLRRDKERSPEKEKEAKTAAEFHVEEYDTLDNLVVMKGKEGDGLVGISAMSILILSPLPVDLGKVLVTLRICLTSKTAQTD